MRVTRIAAFITSAFVGGALLTLPAMASDLSSSDSCRTKATRGDGKRYDCRISLSITAPEGRAIDPDSVEVIAGRTSDHASCTAPKLVYEGGQVVAVEAAGDVKSGKYPGSRGQVQCTLSADLAG